MRACFVSISLDGKTGRGLILNGRSAGLYCESLYQWNIEADHEAKKKDVIAANIRYRIPNG